MGESDDERIRAALQALLVEDVDGLRSALEADPEVVNLKIGNDTMLELMTQPEGGPPSPEMAGVLIDAGAYLDRALNLAGCWNLASLCAQLLGGGADPAARADAGITPLESAAMHSSTEAADVLVAHGLHRPSLWLAPAVGSLREPSDSRHARRSHAHHQRPARMRVQEALHPVCRSGLGWPQAEPGVEIA